MKILLDQGAPTPLREVLVNHVVETAYERGWSTFTNGELLRAAETAAFDLLITTDQNLGRQQKLYGRTLAILVLPTTRWPEIERRTAYVRQAVNSMQSGEYRELTWEKHSE
jgi:predicted nuclease of predicted toxin-antitoxin system